MLISNAIRLCGIIFCVFHALMLIILLPLYAKEEILGQDRKFGVLVVILTSLQTIILILGVQYLYIVNATDDLSKQRREALESCSYLCFIIHVCFCTWAYIANPLWTYTTPLMVMLYAWILVYLLVFVIWAIGGLIYLCCPCLAPSSVTTDIAVEIV